MIFLIVKRGDIFYADLSPVIGSEQGGIRPVLIIQNDIGNRYSPTVIIAAITSQINKAKLPTHIEADSKKYALINKSGEPLFAPVVDDIYMTYEGGKYNYIMNYNDATMNVEDYLKQTGVTRGGNATNNIEIEESNSTQNIEEGQQMTEQTQEIENQQQQ